MSFFRNYLHDEEDTTPSFLRVTKAILILLIVGNAALLPLISGMFGAGSHNLIAFVFLSGALMFEVIALYLAYLGKPAMAKMIVPLALILTVTFSASAGNGLRDISLIGMPCILIVSGLLIGKRAMWIVTPLSIISVLMIALVDFNNNEPLQETGWSHAVIIALLLIVCATAIQILINRLNENIQKARENERLKIIENRELNELHESLEDRVARRTSELEIANRRHERRVSQFEAISHVTRVITTIQDIDTLLPYITQVISEHFNIYHTGIFLLDRAREYAVLRAANSDGGRRMLVRGHKLRVGQTGIVGYVTATGQARIALDVGSDVTYFDNPDMPETRSEIALPLRYAGQVIGALDVQSIEPNAFLQDDIEVLTTLADQVAAIINNAMVLEESRKQLEKYQRTIDEGMREYWKVMRPKSLGLGLHLSDENIQPLHKPLEGEHIQDAIAQNKVIAHTPKDGPAALAIPLRLRGKVIGVLNLTTKGSYRLSSDDTEIVEAVTERLSLAMETATLLQATRHRANLERVTADVSSRISSSSRFETIMQTAAQEISRALGGSDVTVQIEPISIELGMGS
jgi:GAF domain-containing protein